MPKMIQIRVPVKPSEFKALEDIQRDAWGADDITITPHHLLTAIAISSNCIYIAEYNGEIIGFVFGFLGFETRGNQKAIILHSHQLAVRRKFQNKNIGYLLKLKQREYAIRNNIPIIKWTFDPLQSKNAYFNFNKLGVISVDYIRNLYGELRDELNKGLPTDRLYVSWYINSLRVQNRLYKKSRPPAFEQVINGAELVTKTLTGHHFLTLRDYSTSSRSKFILVEIPKNITEIKKSSPTIALDWRLGLRKIFETYLKKEYIIIDVIANLKKTRIFYLLSRMHLKDILNKNWWDLL